MSLHEEKHSYIRYELGILTLNGALSTRAVGAPIYSIAFQAYQREPFKNALRNELRNIEIEYSKGRVDGNAHCDYIANLADRISQIYGEYLHNGRFRFGVAQKLVNLYLKYLWSIGLIEEPPHCPLDGIVRNLATLKYDWITSDSREEYEAAIEALSLHANPRSLSVWELQEFRRREQGSA